MKDKSHIGSKTISEDVDSKSYYALGLFIGAVVLVLFSGTLQNELLVWDDNKLITDNLRIRSLSPSYIKALFTDIALTLWYPVTMLSFAMDYAVWGLNPKGYHLTNNILHASNTFFVFLLAGGLASYLKGGRRDKAVLVTAAVTALFFGIHPLRVESVAWASERKDVLYSFFYLLSLLSYLKYSSGKQSKITVFYLLSILLFAASLMSKPMAVSLPLVLLMLDYYPLGRIKEYKRVFLEKIPYFALTIGFSYLTVATNSSRGSLVGLATYPLSWRFLQPVKSYIFYLYKMVLPLELAPYYPFPQDISIISLEHGFPVLAFIIITALSIYFFKRRRVVGIVWLYYVITLMPVIGIIQLGEYGAANRYTYLPSLGPFLLIGLLAAIPFAGTATSTAGQKSDAGRYRALVIAVVLVIGAFFSLLTMQNISYWKNTVTVWTRQIELYPGQVALAYNNRGIAFNDLGDKAAAMSDYTTAISISSKFVKAYNNRGIILKEAGRVEEAIEDFNKAIELDEKFKKPFLNRGNANMALGNVELAKADYSRAIELDPLFFEAYYNRGGAYNRTGETEKAMADYDKAIRLNPGFAQAYSNRGNLYLSGDYYEAAISDYSRAIEISPDHPNAYSNRGNAYRRVGKAKLAMKDFDRAIELAPGLYLAYYNRALLRDVEGDKDGAIKDYARTLKINPKYRNAYFRMGVIYRERGEKREAMAFIKRAASLGHPAARRMLVR